MSNLLSGSAAPVVDAVVVGGEAVADAPQHGLRPAGDADLAIDRADVGLDGVGAEVGQCRDLGVALALGDQGEDLRLAVGEAFARPGQSSPGALRAPARRVADHDLAGVDGFQRGHELAGGKVLDR